MDFNGSCCYEEGEKGEEKMRKDGIYEIEVKNWVWYLSWIALIMCLISKSTALVIFVFLMWMANIKIKGVKQKCENN